MTTQRPRRERYQAFLSYASADEEWARWLQRTLERYRVPKELVGQTGRYGLIGPNLSPIFRDRDDLEAHGNLSQRLQDGLEQSRFLVVVCSPASARSSWVDAEIRHFVTLGRRDRILAVVVDGDPGAVDEQRCFPEALLSQSTESDPTGSDSLSNQPLAADARQEGDGKDSARLKIIAGLLGLSLTDLTQREVVAERRRRRFSQLIAAVLAILTIAALIGAGFAYWQRTIAVQEEQRANENLDIAVGSLERVVFGISRGLRGIEGVSRSAVRTVLGSMINEIDAASRQTPNDLRIAELQVALLNELAEISAAQEDPEALAAIVTRLDELAARHESSAFTRAIVVPYARSLSLFYQGKRGIITGDHESAAASFRQLERDAPDLSDHDASLELKIAALVELGDILMSSGKEEEARGLYQKAIRQLESLPGVAPPSSATSWRLDRDLRQLRQRGLLFERLGQVETRLGNRPSALSLYAKAVTIAESLNAALPSDTTVQLDLAFARALRGRALIDSGAGAEGLQALTRAADMLKGIDELSPGRVEILQPYAEILEDMVKHSRAAGVAEASLLEHTRQAVDVYRSLLTVQSDNTWRDSLVEHSVRASRMLRAKNDDSAAVGYLQAARRLLIDSVELPAGVADFLRLGELHGELAVQWLEMDDLVAATNDAALALDTAKSAYALDDRAVGQLATRMRNYADFLALADRSAEASAVLEQAKKFTPEASRDGDDLTAEQRMRDATRLSREAFIRFRNSDVDTSIIMMKRALAVLPEDPRHVAALEKRLYWGDALGGYYLLKKDFSRARAAFEEGLKASQQRIDAGEPGTRVLSYHHALMGKIGWIEVQENNRQAAISWFTKAADATRYRARKFPADASAARALDLYDKALQNLGESWPESGSEIPLIMP